MAEVKQYVTKKRK